MGHENSMKIETHWVTEKNEYRRGKEVISGIRKEAVQRNF